MFFPVRTDRRLRRRPWLNHALIAANVLVFFLTHSRGRLTAVADLFILNPWSADPAGPLLGGFPYQFLSYQFLHADLMHLLSNMIFLYVFGASVEDRLGKLGYLAFYLAGGTLAGLAHVLTETAPVLGASGSVAAVTGAYLALFPLSNVTIVYWFIFIGAFEISSLYLILFQVGQNIVMHLSGAAGVAYGAHLAGYAYGLAVGLGLLWSGLLEREPYDLLALIDRWRRRVQFRAMARRGYQPWIAPSPTTTVGSGTSVPSTDTASPAAGPIPELRACIARALSEHRLGEAAEDYRRLLELDRNQVLSQQHQLDLANHLAAVGWYELAARAYELFLEHYSGDPQRHQVRLMLGLIYARYLKQPERARALLEEARTSLSDPQQKELAEHLLAELNGR